MLHVQRRTTAEHAPPRSGLRRRPLLAYIGFRDLSTLYSLVLSATRRCCQNVNDICALRFHLKGGARRHCSYYSDQHVCA